MDDLPRLHHVADSPRDQKLMSDLDCEPEQFQGRIIFMSMYNDIVWRDPNNEKVCVANSTLVAEYAKKFSLGHWSFLGPGSETKSNATDTCKPGIEWDRVAEIMMINFSESGHPIFRATSAVARGTLKSERDGKLCIHVCGDYVIVEVIFRTIVSVNRLSINGAVVDLCEEFIFPLPSTRKTYVTGFFCSSVEHSKTTSDQ